jgi:hypothetical protein
LSLQVGILKILASHGSGHATLSSLSRDIAILTASGVEWSDRLRRLAARAPGMDIFRNGYVLRDGEGWQITAEGREFLAKLEALTQDNLPPAQEMEHKTSHSAPVASGELIVVGHRFKNRIHRRRMVTSRQ